LRTGRGFTPTEFAKLVNIGRCTVYFWESGRQFPAMDRMHEIARTLGVTLTKLMNPSDDA
jgi:transcriptional regulator with XRE-family HTH domain